MQTSIVPRLLVALLAVLVFPGFLTPGQAAEKKPTKDKSGELQKIDPADDIFTEPKVLRIKITVPKEGINKLRDTEWGHGGSQKDRPVVQATVTEGGRVYTNVAIHLKGAAGSFRPVDDRPALTLNFDKHVKGQRFHGLDKISLNNSVQDPSYISEKLCREIFNAAGVPAPLAAHARVELNGRDLGLYVLVEGWDKTFLKRHFKNTKGNLYDGGFLREVTDDLDVNSGDNPKDKSGLDRLARAAMTARATRFEQLDKILDTERFLTMIALEVMMCHWDGYGMNKNNFRVFHDLGTGRMVFMPHGMDQMFGVMRSSPNEPIIQRMEGLVARAILETPEGRRRFMAKIPQLLTNVFQAEALTNRVRKIAAVINPVIAERSAGTARNHQREVNSLCRRIEERIRYLSEQSSTPIDTLKFDEAGLAQLKGWKSRQDFNKPLLDEVKDADGKTLLHISMKPGSGVGSWRTRVQLEAGSYRLEGRVKAQEVAPDPGDKRAGAGLRVAGQPQRQGKLIGDVDWTELGFEFEIIDPFKEMDLMCELRAGKGEAWFDAGSLRLRKL